MCFKKRQDAVIEDICGHQGVLAVIEFAAGYPRVGVDSARRQGLGDVISFKDRMKTLDEVGTQRTREFGGAPRRDINAIPETLDANATENTREFYDYYRTSEHYSM